MHRPTRAMPIETSAIVRKINARNVLSPDEIQALEAIQTDTRSYPTKSDILRAGQAIERPIILRSGWVFSYQSLSDGRRQIVNFLLPGDLFGAFGRFPRVASVSLACLTPVETAFVPPGALEDRKSTRLNSSH